MASGQHHDLMSEEEVQEYFISNGGVVRNNEIVTYFRKYLANPAIRDEARALFKVIVNKLATVKVENGEKFLVLKRQYFLPIDGNGNATAIGLPSPPRQSATPYGDRRLSSGAPAGGANTSGYSGQNLGLPSPGTGFSPFQFQAPPPYVSSGSYPSVTSMSPPYQQEQISRSQIPQYGSQYSINSNYGSPQYNRSPPVMPTPDYEYGLPPPPKMLPSRRLSFSSPNSVGSSPGSGGSPAGRLIPPPYRAPPPAPPTSTPQTPVLSPPAPGMRPMPFNFKSTSSMAAGLTNDHQLEGHNPRPQYKRSQSVSGLSKAAAGVSNSKPGSHSASPSSGSPPFFPTPTGPNFTSPPPPVPPRAKRSASFIESTPVGLSSPSSTASTVTMDEATINSSQNLDKENESPSISEGMTPTVNGIRVSLSDSEQKISVRERMQKFNLVNSNSETESKSPNGTPKSKGSGKHDSGDFDTASLSSYSYGYASEPKGREWILKAARSDYAGINKMAQEMPNLVKRKDINGYTALHWAAKHGHADLVKLLAGTYKSSVNVKSNGGYTPLHLAAQFSRQEVYDLLVTVYNADANIRDHSGKKPMQYLVRQDTSVSLDTFKKLKEKRRSTEQGKDHRESYIGNSFLRIGSLNVRVKKTTEAFGNFLAKSNSSAQIERGKKWGSSDSLPEAGNEKDKEMMPPPSGGFSKGKKSKSRKQLPPSSPSECRAQNKTITEDQSGSESDTACGFGTEWKSPN